MLRTLKPVIDKRVEIATVDSRVERLESEKQTIVSDQQRLRENMKALRGTAEEKQLLQRYTRQLDGQETRLEELQRDLAQASEQRDKLRAELTALIEKLSFETVPK